MTVEINNQKTIRKHKKLTDNNIKLIKYIIDKNLPYKISGSFTGKILSNEPEYLELLKLNISEVLNISIETIKNLKALDERKVLRQIYNNQTVKLFLFLSHLSEKTGKPMEDFTELDFSIHQLMKV